MSFQPDPNATGSYYPESHQVEVINLESLSFNQGFSFGCGFWLAGIILWFLFGLLGSIIFYLYAWLIV